MSGVVLVTGGQGFIGRRLVALLKEKGNDVRVVDKENGGVLNSSYLSNQMQDVTTVFHLGAVSGSLFFSTDPIGGVRVNCEGTVNLLEAVLRNGVKRVVFAGTMSAYGFTPIPHKEDGPVNCVNPYVATKLFGERMMRLYFENHGLETVCLRYASVYGPGEETKGRVANPVTQFIRSLLREECPRVFGDGEQTRDLICVDDVARANIVAALHGHPGETYNVSTGAETSFNAVIAMLRKIHGKKFKVLHTQWKPYDQQREYIDRQCGSFVKLRTHTHWEPRVPLESGLRLAYDYFKKSRAC